METTESLHNLQEKVNLIKSFVGCTAEFSAAYDEFQQRINDALSSAPGIGPLTEDTKNNVLDPEMELGEEATKVIIELRGWLATQHKSFV